MSPIVTEAWYAPPGRFHSLHRWASLSQKGILEIYSQRILFTGGAVSFEARSIRSVTIVERPIPWLSLLIENGALLFLFTGGFRSFAAIRNLAAPSLLVGANALVLYKLAGIQWVDIEYVDEGEQIRHAYFSDGSTRGFGRGLGGADRLAELIRSGLRGPSEDCQMDTKVLAAEQADKEDLEGSILVACESCSRKSIYPQACRGKVEKCSTCGQFVDVV